MTASSSLVRLLLAAAVTGLFLWAWQSQFEAPKTAPATDFSPSHAFATLSGLLKEQVPHPSGSPENGVVRDRILAEFRSYGYEPQIQSAFQCDPKARTPGCTQVENIVALRKGTGEGRAILATAHYDSVPSGPGVSDDGVGVAVMLELARHLKTQPASRNDVIILLTDGEETGLKGAVAFARQSPLMKSVALVVNVEARGDTGPSVMFETGQGNARLMDLFASTAPGPISNSLAFELYRLLPNDTDFTIYKRSNLTGFNFANIGSASRYHSPRDDLSHLDQNTLKHHGDHIFALVGKLLDTDLASLMTAADASYFDVFGKFMVVWPAAANLPLAILALVAMVGLLVRHRRDFSLSATGLGIVSMLLTFGLLFATGWLLARPLSIWPGVHPLDDPFPWAPRIALVAGALLVVLTIATLFSSRVPARIAAPINWTLLSVLCVACAATLPGAAYALLWPALAFAGLGWAESLLRRDAPLALAPAIGFALIAFFWVGHFIALEAVIGFDASQFKLLALAPFALALVPLFAPGQGGLRGQAVAILLAAVVMAGAAVLAARTPGFSGDHPRALNVVYYDDLDAGKPRWLISEIPADEAYLQHQGFSPAPVEFSYMGVFDAKGRFRPAVDAGFAGPTFSVEARSTHARLAVVTASLQAARAGFVMGLGVPKGSGIRSISVEGQLVAGPERLSGKDGVYARLFGLGNRAVKVEIEFEQARPADLVIFERSPLPDTPEARQLLATRPANAAWVHSGDGALVFRQVDLAALKPAAPAGPQGP